MSRLFSPLAGVPLAAAFWMGLPAAAGEQGPAPLKPSKDPGWETYPEDVKNKKRAEYAAWKMRQQLGADFKIEIHAPYVIGTNTSPERLERMKKEVLTDFSNAVRRQFDFKNTRHDMRVYLFKKGSNDYETYARRLWGGAPPGAAAYALPNERALMVPDSGGGVGTIKHEIMHLLIRYEVPDPAPWFDEGFAAFFEQAWLDPSGERVVTTRHHRLENAQQAMKNGIVSLPALVKLSDEEFRDGKEGYSYAVGAHLFIWLQEQGLLEKTVGAYRDTAKADRTGRTAVEKATGRRLEEVEAEFKAWLLKRVNPETAGPPERKAALEPAPSGPPGDGPPPGEGPPAKTP